MLPRTLSANNLFLCNRSALFFLGGGGLLRTLEFVPEADDLVVLPRHLGPQLLQLERQLLRSLLLLLQLLRGLPGQDLRGDV